MGRGDLLGDGDTGGQVLDGGGAGLQAGGDDGALHGVTGGDGDAGEVDGHVGVPLVPGVVGGGQGPLGPGDTGLEDGSSCAKESVYVRYHNNSALPSTLTKTVEKVCPRPYLQQVSPSRPTQAAPDPVLEGLGTVKTAETPV